MQILSTNGALRNIGFIFHDECLKYTLLSFYSPFALVASTI